VQIAGEGRIAGAGVLAGDVEVDLTAGGRVSATLQLGGFCGNGIVGPDEECDDAPLVRVVNVTSSEPANATGDGQTEPDVLFGTGAFCLRAERRGNGEKGPNGKKNGRVYTVTLEATDASGRAILDLLRAGGHQVAGRQIVPDEPDQVRASIHEQLNKADVQAIITTGGTGIASRDTTYEAIDGLLEKRIDGFGELFRALSYQAIGSAAMLSRACAGPRRSRPSPGRRSPSPRPLRRRTTCAARTIW
jgi:molybdenum cofactor biosynthesis protein B